MHLTASFYRRCAKLARCQQTGGVTVINQGIKLSQQLGVICRQQYIFEHEVGLSELGKGLWRHRASDQRQRITLRPDELNRSN